MNSQTRLKLLNKILTEIISGRPLQEVVSYSLRQLASQYKSLMVCCSVVDPQGRLTVLSVASPKTHVRMTNQTFDLNQAPKYLAALRKREPVIVHDVEKDARLAPIRDYLAARGARAIMDVPMHYSGKLVGLLCFAAPKPHRWTHSEILVLTEAAQHLSVAVESAKAQEQLRHANERLTESQKRLQAVVDSAPIILFTMDKNGIVTLSQGHGLKALGVKPGQLVGMSVFDLYKDIPDFQASARRVIEGEALTTVMCLNGAWLETRLEPLVDGQGRPAGTIGVTVNITERYRAEKALTETEQRLQAVVDSAPIVLFSVDQNGIFKLSRGRGLQKLGLKPDQVVGQSVFELYKDFPWILESMRRALSGESVSVQGEVGPLWYETRFEPVMNAEGQTIGVIGVATDITEIKQYADQLLFSQKLLTETQKLAKIGSWQGDLVAKTTIWSDELYRLLGLNPDRHQGSYSLFLSCLHPDDRPSIEQKVQRTMKDGGQFSYTCRMIRPGGEMRYLHGTTRAELGKNGQPVRLYGFVQDVTDQHRDQSKLENSLSMLVATIESTADGILVVNYEGRITAYNGQFLRMWKIPQDVLDSHDDRRALEVACAQLKDPDSFMAKVKQLYDAPESESFDILEFADGRVFERFSKPQRINGRPVGRVWSFRDVTARNQALSSVAQKARELAQSNRELEQFAHVTSHDLKEPLRLVTSYLSLLDHHYGPALDGDAKKYISRAVNGAQRMQSLINDLLDYSLVGNTEPDNPVDCKQVLVKALDNLRSALDEAGAKVQANPLPSLRVVEIEMLQLFQNLISNAVKFRRGDAPNIRISAERKSLEWIFSVQDNGIGVDPQYYDRIFHVFERLHPRDAYPGTGIGLAICKKIVARYGGKIWVSPAPDGGSIFNFSIPDRKEGG